MRELLHSLNYEAWALPALLLIPLVGAVITRFLGRPISAAPGEPGFDWREPHVLTLATLFIEAIVAAGLWFAFVPTEAGWQVVTDAAWIPDWGARFTLGVDGISLFMVLLTVFVVPLSVLGSWTQVRERANSYYALLLALTTGIIGVFVAMDLLLFYIFWELMLVPMYFIIGIWGGAGRIAASLKYFIYTMLGSLLMLVAILALWIAGGSTSFSYDHLLANVGLSPTAQFWMFGAFFLAFAVKSPLFPFHTWLPDAQHEAPTTGAVALGIKVATYGIIRFAVPFFPAVAVDPMVKNIILTLSVISIVYGALVAMVQPDFKRLVSYSSISHLGFIMLGIFALNTQSVQGALMVMLSAGITTTALFLLLGMLHERRRTGMIHNFGGIARVVPMFSAFLVLAALSSIGLPGTSGFVGEFLVLLGAYRNYPLYTFAAASGVIFAAIYFLWALQRLLFNPITVENVRTLRDLNRRELGVMTVLSIALLVLGIAPGPILRRIEPSAQRFVETVQQGAEAIEREAPVTP